MLASRASLFENLKQYRKPKQNEPREAAHLKANSEDLSGERFDGAGEAALVASGFIFMHDFLIGDAVDDAGRLLKDFQCGSLVAAFDCFANFLNGGTQGRTQADIVGATFLALFRALSGLFGICHGDSCAEKSIRDYKTIWIGWEQKNNPAFWRGCFAKTADQVGQLDPAEL